MHAQLYPLRSSELSLPHVSSVSSKDPDANEQMCRIIGTVTGRLRYKAVPKSRVD